MIEGAFRLLSVLPDLPGPQQISGLARAAGMPRPTVHRLIRQLQAGAVQRIRDRWVVGPTLLNFVQSTELIPGLRDQSFPVLHQLRNQTGATVSVVVPDDQASRILEILHGHTLSNAPASSVKRCRPPPQPSECCRAQPRGLADDLNLPPSTTKTR